MPQFLIPYRQRAALTLRVLLSPPTNPPGNPPTIHSPSLPSDPPPSALCLVRVLQVLSASHFQEKQQNRRKELKLESLFSDDGDGRLAGVAENDEGKRHRCVGVLCTLSLLSC